MLKRAVLLMVVALGSSSCTMWKNQPKGWQGATGGEKIEQYFWDDVKSKDFRKIGARLSSTLIVTGPGGSMNRDNFVKYLQSLNVSSISLNDCSSNLNGGDLMISCTLQRDGGRFATLSVWQQYSKGWILVAHSETPVSQ